VGNDNRVATAKKNKRGVTAGGKKGGETHRVLASVAETVPKKFSLTTGSRNNDP